MGELAEDSTNFDISINTTRYSFLFKANSTPGIFTSDINRENIRKLVGSYLDILDEYLGYSDVVYDAAQIDKTDYIIKNMMLNFIRLSLEIKQSDVGSMNKDNAVLEYLSSSKPKKRFTDLTECMYEDLNLENMKIVDDIDDNGINSKNDRIENRYNHLVYNDNRQIINGTILGMIYLLDTISSYIPSVDDPDAMCNIIIESMIRIVESNRMELKVLEEVFVSDFPDVLRFQRSLPHIEVNLS